MPLFDYQCEDCGSWAERLILPGSKVFDYIMCPDCGGHQVRKLGRPNFKINGYNEANGYAKKGSI